MTAVVRINIESIRGTAERIDCADVEIIVAFIHKSQIQLAILIPSTVQPPWFKNRVSLEQRLFS